VGVLDRRDVARLRGVKAGTIKAYQQRYPEGHPYAFPVPDDTKNGGPVWDESRADELRAWQGRGRGTGGGRRRKTSAGDTPATGAVAHAAPSTREAQHAPAPVTVDVPGAFHTFLSGTGGAQGEDGETPFFLAYCTARRVARGRGYTLRLTVPASDAREVLGDLIVYAEACISANQDQVHEPGARSELAAAHKVLDRCLTAQRGLLRRSRTPARGAESHADASSG